MGADVVAVAWKEWREILRPDGRSWIERLRIPIAVGVGLAFTWRIGPAFGSSWITLGPLALVMALAVLPVAADSFAGERERHTLETLLSSRVSDRAVVLGKVLAPVALGMALALMVLAGGIVLARLRGGVVAPVNAGVAAAAAVLALLLGVMVAGAGVLVSMGAATVKEAQQRLSLSLLAIAFLPGVLGRALPEGVKARAVAMLDTLSPAGVAAAGLGFLVLLDLALVLAALARFRRSRVAFD